MTWSDRFRRRRGFRTIACIAASAAVVASLASANAATDLQASGSAPAAPADKIKPKLQQQLDAGGAADFWVRFEASADLSGASAIQDWVERGTQVVNALRKTAKASQGGVRARLEADGADYETFWATNAIYVREGSAALAEELAARQEVASLHPTIAYEVPDPDEGADVQTLASVEWGIASINADDVWQQYGVRGAGITVANIDTGVQYSHPALVRQYRGNLGNGSFDHDYNWFDAAGRCAGAPCDVNGHGTHTMGTMAGDDGAGNQIGVAPEVTWIAANGCCPSDTALVASGQWMLQPTDLAGQNPDAGKRPNVINNSWGSQTVSNDPFIEDIALAWEASGIFAAWSNGNLGPACRTSSSPGSRLVNYSVGALDSAGNIADFSSRGAGQDGEIKPNVSAPGVNVRSSVPGSGYATASGTSMAAPHVAGAVALLWSAAPGLVGDVEATRAMLDGSASDIPDDRCGGTADDNNVFGEGGLDALALVDSAPVDDTGTLAVTVTDASTREPIAGAKLSIAGPIARERVTGADGTESLPLPPGEYTVSVSAFGHAEQTAAATIATGQTTALSFPLEALPTVKVRGRVSDGSGHGWPLYASITVDGVPDGTFFTNPVNGRYSFNLPADSAYTLTIRSRYGGYETVTDELAVGHHHVTRDFTVPVDVDQCAGAGSAYGYDGPEEDFDDGSPEGWAVVDHIGTGNVWRFDDPFNRGNLTGGTGAFAIAQSPGGAGGALDSSLVTPVIDLTGHVAPILRFRQDFLRLQDIAEVDLSVDGGATWQNVLRQTANARGPREEIVPIPQAAGRQQVRVRFHLFQSAFNSRFWQIDDVFVGTRSCDPQPGGLVLGHVRDRNTGSVVDGAVVASDDRPQESARSEATPDDPGLDDGFYWLFSSLTGGHGFTATADVYAADRQSASVDESRVTELDFRLPAGLLTVEPDALTAGVRTGHSTKLTFTVRNTGTAPARVELRERDGTYPIPRAAMAESGTAGGAGVVRIEGDFSPLALTGIPGGPSAAEPARNGPAAAPWVDLAEYPTRIMDNTVGDLNGRIYSVGGVDGNEIVARGFVYDPAAQSWAPIADLPEGREAASGAFIDGLFYVSGGWDTGTRATRTTFAYDPESDSWSSLADGPVFAAAAGRAVLDGQLYLVGGCTNACGLTEVRRYDPVSNSWQMLADYPVPNSHVACAGIAGRVHCAGGIRRGNIIWNSTYAYDPATNTWTQMADLPIAAWGMGYTGSSDRLIVSGGITAGGITNESFVYEPATDTWSRLPASNNVLYRGGSTCGLTRVGGSMLSGFVPVDSVELLPTYGDCVPTDVPWLSLEPESVILPPGAKIKVTVRLDAAGSQPGTYAAGAWIKQDTPYLVYPVDVTMVVTPP